MSAASDEAVNEAMDRALFWLALYRDIRDADRVERPGDTVTDRVLIAATNYAMGGPV